MTLKVTRENLAESVKRALLLCSEQLARASKSATEKSMLQDLRVAQQALELIDSELTSGDVETRQPRSGIFTRYVLDEEPRLVLDPVLRDLILKIEHVYRRKYP